MEILPRILIFPFVEFLVKLLAISEIFLFLLKVRLSQILINLLFSGKVLSIFRKCEFSIFFIMSLTTILKDHQYSFYLKKQIKVLSLPFALKRKMYANKGTLRSLKGYSQRLNWQKWRSEESKITLHYFELDIERPKKNQVKLMIYRLFVEIEKSKLNLL